ncbi:unnamed protein product [Aphanomyces euteiches]|nr:hypothetical protein Ae201684P_007268 [Aphanomyces euteiches]KAH9150997.1 hypothetical protein AeRB84_006285 [Aphanomyces euteiches]
MIASASKEANVVTQSSRDGSEGQVALEQLTPLMNKLMRAKLKIKELSTSLEQSESRFLKLKKKSEIQLKKIDGVADRLVVSTIYKFWNFVGEQAFIKGDPAPLIQAFLGTDKTILEQFTGFAVNSTPIQPRLFEPPSLDITDAVVYSFGG